MEIGRSTVAPPLPPFWCAASGVVSAFGPLADLQTRYGKVASIEGLPDPSATQPSVVFKQADTHKQFVPYDSAKALQLLATRGNLPPVYTSPSDVTVIPAGIVGRDHLVLKPKGVTDPTDTSVHDEG